MIKQKLRDLMAVGLANILRRFAFDPKYFDLWQSQGYHIKPTSFYSPLPDTRELLNNIWDDISPNLGAIEWNEVQQLQFLKTFQEKYFHEYHVFTERKPNNSQFYLGNVSFETVDAEILYCMVRYFRPHQIIEIGSGYSSLLAVEALAKNISEGYQGSFTAIEPYPPEFLHHKLPITIELLEQPVQKVPLERFASLKSGDILFTDEYLNPFLHTWSLGIEAQFYLLFPLLLILAKIFDKNKNYYKLKSVQLTILIISLLISLIISFVFTSVNPILAYYLMPSRFWEMASGAILFLSLTDYSKIPHNNNKIIRILLELSSVFLIGLGFFLAKPNSAFPFPMAIPTVIGTLIFIFLGYNQKSHLNKLVSNRLCLYLGKISYSLYLWHWPVFTILRWTIGLDTIEQISIAILLTISFGIVSYQFVEIPFLQKKNVNSKLVLVLGLLIMTLCWRINLAFIERGWYFNYTLSTTKQAQTWYAWEYKNAVDNECFIDNSYNFSEGQKITINMDLCDKYNLPKKTVYTLGDSHSMSLLPMLIDAMKKRKFNNVLYSKTGCAVLGLTNPDSQCIQFQLHALKEIEKNSQPGDILLLPALRVDRLESGIPGGKTHLLRKSDDTLLKIAPDVEMYLKNLNQRGLSIVLPDPWPVFTASAQRCADWFNKDNLYCHGTVINKDFLLDHRKKTMKQLIAYSQTRREIYIWDSFLVMCPGNQCTAFLGNKPLYMDGDHLSNFGSRYLTNSFLSLLAQL